MLCMCEISKYQIKISNVQCTLDIHCTMYIVQCTLYN